MWYVIESQVLGGATNATSSVGTAITANGNAPITKAGVGGSSIDRNFGRPTLTTATPAMIETTAQNPSTYGNRSCPISPSPSVLTTTKTPQTTAADISASRQPRDESKRIQISSSASAGRAPRTITRRQLSAVLSRPTRAASGPTSPRGGEASSP